jgi:hypothetical protein
MMMSKRFSLHYEFDGSNFRPGDPRQKQRKTTMKAATKMIGKQQ